MSETEPRQRLESRFFDLSARVETLFWLKAQMLEAENCSDDLKEFLQQLEADKLPTLFGLSGKAAEAIGEIDDCYDQFSDLVEILTDLNVNGVLFEVIGPIWEHRPGKPGTLWRSRVEAIELGYSPTMEGLEDAIHKALDRLEPRLRVEKE